MAGTNEEELLSSLEESLDLDYSGRGGFVSSFMLPSTLDTAPSQSHAEQSASRPQQLSSITRTIPRNNNLKDDIFRSPSSHSSRLSSPPVATTAASSLSIQIPPTNLVPPPDLLSPHSIASDGTDMVSNMNTDERVTTTKSVSTAFHVSHPSLDTVNKKSSAFPRSGNHASSPRGKELLNNQKRQGRSKTSHDKPRNEMSSNYTPKRKKKSSSRKNNLVILPVPFRHAKSDVSKIKSASHQYSNAQNLSPDLPPPHPMSHVQSYSPYQQHLHHSCHSFSDGSSSEATPITSVRRNRNFSIDESLGPHDFSNDTETQQHDEEKGIPPSYRQSNNDSYFQDFDDSLSRDSANNKEGDLIGVDIQMNTPVEDTVPHSISTNSLLGLDIIPTHSHDQQQKHNKLSSLEYSPATMITLLDANESNTISLPQMPEEDNTVMQQHIISSPPNNIQYMNDEITDDGSLLSAQPCSVLDDTPPTSPDPYAHRSPQKRHHRHQSSLVSCSESCLQSLASYESQNIFNRPNPKPRFLTEAGLSPSYSYEEDRSLCADEKAFVQQIHNSGLSTWSFEHVDDVIENTSIEEGMELIYNNGSFDAGSVGESSVESMASVEEKEEMKRRLRKFREKRSRMDDDRRGVINGGAADKQSRRLDNATPATPVASNRAFQQLGMPDMHAIEQFNQECEESFEMFEMTPLTSMTSSSDTGKELHDVNNTQLDYRETKLHPINDPGWRLFYTFRNLVWWWQLQPSTFSNTSFGNSSAHDQQSRHNAHYTYKGFDDVDFDRNKSSCCCCPRNSGKFWYAQTSWNRLLITASLFFIIGWIFSDEGLKKHHTEKASYPNYHRTKHGYQLYGRDDPLAKEAFIPIKELVDDTDDASGLLSREDDDIDYSVVEKYFPAELQSAVDLDDIFRKFEMEDDIFSTTADETLYSDTAGMTDTSSALLADVEEEVSDNSVANIDTIVVLGERHVGLEWLVKKLETLYPKLTISSGFPSNNNHLDGEWFQPEEEEVYYESTYKHILVIALFINPYDWVELMHADPICAPNHKAMDWKEFIETEWSPIDHSHGGKETIIDASLTKELPLNPIIPDDDDDADWDDVLDAVSSDINSGRRLGSNTDGDSSCYEFKQGTSTYYNSILELRADKIRAAVKGSLYRRGVFTAIPVRYEDLLNDDSTSLLPGIVGLVGQIQTLAGISPEADLNDSFLPSRIGCNGHVCHMSINAMKKNGEYVGYLNSHLDWHAEQLIGYQKASLPKPSVQQIVVLGERHSRAGWLVERLSRCFPDVEVKYGFNRPGKFFQSTTESNPKTLVIALFINPYDWAQQMWKNPINAPSHKNMEFSEFVTSPWERTRSHLDGAIVDTSVENCSYDFTFHEIIPCHTQRDPETADFPLYELRHPPSGFVASDDYPYSNILDLRADKIQNFLSTAYYPGVVDLIKIRFEDLVWDKDASSTESAYTLPFPGIAGLLEIIRDRTCLIPDVLAGWILDETGFFKAEPLDTEIQLDEEYVKLMENHIDWSVESLIGYGDFKNNRLVDDQTN